MRGLRRRHGRAKASAFTTAARKVERLIADIEAGHTEHDADSRAFTAINKLEDRAYADWRKHGEDARREAEYATAKALRERMRAAVDIGYEARRARRSREIAEITAKERERLSNMTPSERALHQYQQELKLTRGGR